MSISNETIHVIIHVIMQVGLVGFTALGFLLTSLKLPQYGLVANLTSQIFWLYSSYIAWRDAGQIGIFVATILIVLILIGGVVNYWFLGRDHHAERPQ